MRLARAPDQQARTHRVRPLPCGPEEWGTFSSRSPLCLTRLAVSFETALLHLDSARGPLVLQHHCNRIDDADLRVRLAVHDDLVLEPHPAGGVEEVLLGKTVVPAAVPDHQLVGILLPGSGKLSAGELLHVEITVRVGIGFEIRLGSGRRAISPSGSTDSREHRGAARALALTASPRRPPNLRRVMETPSPATALGAALSMPRSEAWFREPHYRRREGGARVAEAELVKIRAEAASSRGLLLDVEVCGVELSGLLQAVPIFDDDAAALRRADQTVTPELLERAVDMHRREAGGVAELGLRDGHLEGLAVYQADGPEAHIDLAHDVREPGVGIAATDIDHPLPKYRRVDERVAPEHIRDARVRTKEGPNRVMRDECHLARDDCREAVIHDLEVQA